MQSTMQFHEQTLNEARAHVAQNRIEGVICPCCDQYVKIYKRPISGKTAALLIHAHNKFGKNIFHISDLPSIGSGGGDFAKLRYWNLIRESHAPKKYEGAKTSGYWQMTQDGFDFVMGFIGVSKYQIILNGESIGQSGPLVKIRDCLGTKFDYQKLMYGYDD